MYYRRKIIIELLNKFEGNLSRIRFFKLLFLFCEEQDKPSFCFIPYQYGCYSFQAEQDLSVLKKLGYLYDNNSVELKKIPSDIKLLDNCSQALTKVRNLFGNYSDDELIKYVYENHPYYAINSKIKHKYSTPDFKYNDNDEKTIYSIGYEGKDIDAYLNQLVFNNVSLLCDVRKNPISMKFGFSKNQLKNYCEKLNIKYMHFPEFGIESDKRKNLNSGSDYELLFSGYVSDNLNNRKEQINNFINVISSHQKVAFTCFEANHTMCHRSHLIDFIFKSHDLDFSVSHL